MVRSILFFRPFCFLWQHGYIIGQGRNYFSVTTKFLDITNYLYSCAGYTQQGVIVDTIQRVVPDKDQYFAAVIGYKEFGSTASSFDTADLPDDGDALAHVVPQTTDGLYWG